MNEVPLLVAELSALAAEAQLDLQHLKTAALTVDFSVVALLDSVSIDIAQRYGQGELDFDFADRVMNTLWAIVCTEEFLSSHDRTIPEVTQEVFLAFDEGEYFHTQDARDINPEQKYTKPLIAEFLRRHSERSNEK